MRPDAALVNPGPAPAAAAARADAPQQFADVLAGELDALRPDATGDDPGQRADNARMCGLAFSGGGIRSATFNLGILQGLCSARLLRHFDYLSTVSGGGYIGAWLTALIHRLGGGRVEYVEELLGTSTQDSGARPDHPAVRYLRDFSNYLTPRRGLFSGDTWAAFATYLRNFNLNLLGLLATLSIFLLGLRLLLPRVDDVVAALGAPATLLAVFALLLVATLGIATRLPGAQVGASAVWDGRAVAGGVSVLSIMAAVLFSAYVFYEVRQPEPLPDGHWWALGLGMYAGLWLPGWMVFAARRVRMRRGQGLRLPGGAALPRLLTATVATLIAACAAGGLMTLYAHFTVAVLDAASPWWQEQGVSEPVGRWWAAGIGGGVVLLVVFCGTVTLHIGLVGRLFSDADREWWSRLGGWLTGAGLGWMLACASVMYAPMAFTWVRDSLVAAGGLSWLVTTLGGVLMGGGSLAGRGGAGWRDRLLRLAPYAFMLGLLVALAWGLHAALLALDGRGLPTLSPEAAWTDAVRAHLMAASQVPDAAGVMALMLAVGAMLLLGWRVDINLFSLFGFYRDRLVRCYLGASHALEQVPRRPDAFTGFDPGDDLPLADIRATQRPYPILNATLNLVRGRELAWQTRKGAAFAFTPRACGFSLPETGAGGRVAGCSGAWRPTGEYAGGVSLGTAMAVSGAAVSPNMGYHTDPGVAFMLTVFNVRLGRWCGNPCHERAWRRFSPGFAPTYLLRELLGLTHRDAPYVHLCDAAHFENLGIYELVRRRTRWILAVDAGADPDCRFDDLGNAIRKCYADFGAVIDIRLDALRCAGERARPAARHAVGAIHYPAQGRAAATQGTLVYIKATLTGDEPADVLNYSLEHPGFPHQSTADQFFDEAQFESYRRLGEHTALAVFREAVLEAAALTPAGAMPEALFASLEAMGGKRPGGDR
ncbi:MAG: hypothetical protein HY778_10895 [Betaproteobacteria bacterium]|nr:hypothetical protein [Betaproteobacteria bacterium]